MVQEAEYDISKPCPGGPSDQTILSSFNNHVAAAIWNNEVMWDPYSDIRMDDDNAEIAFSTGNLKFFSIVEPYQPDMFLRQMGYIQRIPLPLYKPTRVKRGKFAVSYIAKYNFQPEMWERWQDHVLSARSRGNRATYACEAAPEYIPWFLKISHPTIENPDGGDLRAYWFVRGGLSREAVLGLLYQSQANEVQIHRRVGARRRCLAISFEARSEPLALLSLCRDGLGGSRRFRPGGPSLWLLGPSHDLLDRLRRTVDIVLKWRSLPPGEADMTSAFKMTDDVLMHLTGKGVASSATTTSGGNELVRKFEHDIHAIQSQFHTNANESGSSKRGEHGKLQHKKKRSKTNESLLVCDYNFKCWIYVDFIH
ncbi:hypothetical protein Sjap_008573 [Stephania japonica]|uniref:Aminotransferase-like plant mobile domain-containing protein n=1 Tax=Stephania japonica TaxID=461633 RepID=A0AAP0PCH0_9MAGN